MEFITLENGIAVPKGNYGYIAEATKDQELGNAFMELEAAYQIDYADFSFKTRRAYELLALYVGVIWHKAMPEHAGKSNQKLKNELLQNIKKRRKLANNRGLDLDYSYKNLLKEYCRGKEKRFARMLEQYDFCQDPNRSLFSHLCRYIDFVYNFVSQNIHAGEVDKAAYNMTNENCNRLLRSFFSFVATILEVKVSFQEELLPLGEYYPVPRENCVAHDLYLPERASLFVKEEQLRTRLYLAMKWTGKESVSEARERDAYFELWQNCLEDPRNILRQENMVQTSNHEVRYDLYHLPSFPVTLSGPFFRELELSQREQVMDGILQSIRSLYYCEPPILHRHITPEVFLAISVKGRWKALLADFQFSKKNTDYVVTGDRTKGTVAIKLKEEIEEAEDFFAPETRGRWKSSDEINWEKAEVFSLGQMWLFALSGQMAMEPQDAIALPKRLHISHQKRDLIMDMLCWDPEIRPDLEELWHEYDALVK